MTREEFYKQTQAAAERMREMNKRSENPPSYHGNMPPTPSFVKVNHQPIPQSNENPKEKEPQQMKINNKPNSFFKEIPFLDNLLKDSDTVLIIGLLLILMSDNSDKMLMFALIYILM